MVDKTVPVTSEAALVFNLKTVGMRDAVTIISPRFLTVIVSVVLFTLVSCWP